MKRIAICISGQYRSFTEVSKVYSTLKHNLPELQFDFFLAGWDYEESCFEDFNFFTRKEFFKDDLAKKGGDLQLRISARIFYLQKHVSILREEYEKENGFLYDAVIWTRPDILIYPKYFKTVNQLVNQPLGSRERISNLIIYNYHGVYTVSDGLSIHDDEPFIHDLAALGSSGGMSNYLRTYDNFVNDEGIAVLNAHKAPVFQCHLHNISIVKNEYLRCSIVREKGWQLKLPVGVFKEEQLEEAFTDYDIVERYFKDDISFLKNYVK